MKTVTIEEKLEAQYKNQSELIKEIDKLQRKISILGSGLTKVRHDSILKKTTYHDLYTIADKALEDVRRLL